MDRLEANINARLDRVENKTDQVLDAIAEMKAWRKVFNSIWAGAGVVLGFIFGKS